MLKNVANQAKSSKFSESSNLKHDNDNDNDNDILLLRVNTLCEVSEKTSPACSTYFLFDFAFLSRSQAKKSWSIMPAAKVTANNIAAKVANKSPTVKERASFGIIALLRQKTTLKTPANAETQKTLITLFQKIFFIVVSFNFLFEPAAGVAPAG